MRKLIVLMLVFLCLVSFAYATRGESSSYIIYHTYMTSGVAGANVTGINVSRGSGQHLIGNVSSSNYSLKEGIHYIYNLTLSDLTPPTLSVISPIATTYSTQAIVVNYTATDNVGISSLWYNNGTANTTRNPDNITLVDGTYTFYFWANDTSNNLATASVTFTINTAVTPTPTGGSTPSGAGCRDNSDCPAGYVCENASCHAIVVTREEIYETLNDRIKSSLEKSESTLASVVVGFTNDFFKGNYLLLILTILFIIVMLSLILFAVKRRRKAYVGVSKKRRKVYVGAGKKKRRTYKSEQKKKRKIYAGEQRKNRKPYENLPSGIMGIFSNDTRRLR